MDDELAGSDDPDSLAEARAREDALAAARARENALAAARAREEALAEARAKVEAEFLKVRDSLGDMYVALEAVRAAGPEDDLHGLLDALEDTVKKARRGGVIGSGAKAHRKALARYHELLEPPP